MVRPRELQQQLQAAGTRGVSRKKRGFAFECDLQFGAGYNH